MVNYIKWELKDYLNKKTPWFITYVIVFLLFSLIPVESSNIITNLIVLAFGALLVISSFGSFIFGTKKIIDTYRNKTFLLESMIPFPVKKLQIAKYFIGIIINIIFSLISLIGIAIILCKAGNFEAVIEFFHYFFSEITFSTFIRFSILYILSTITFMSFIILGYILTKVMNPNGGKINTFITTVICFLLLYFFGYLIDSLEFDTLNIEIYYDLIYLITTTILYFITTWLIENKLEIYK